MPSQRPPLYLEREGYRRRRLMDAARVLPVAGLVLILLPVLWARDEAQTAYEAVYLFVLWAVMIAAAALMSRPLRGAIGPDAARAATVGDRVGASGAAHAVAPGGDAPVAAPRAVPPAAAGVAAVRPTVGGADSAR